MPVSVIVDDCHGQEQVFVLDPGNSRIKCLSMGGKFLEHLGKAQLLRLTTDENFLAFQLLNRFFKQRVQV